MGDESGAPSLSVVIPTHDRAALVGRAIESALRQTVPPREVVVVDDGSTDDTRARVEAFGPGVRYLHQGNAGVSAARNHGVRAATGTWIAFLDSDDRWAPNHLAGICAAIVATRGHAPLYFDDNLPDGPGRRSQWEECGFDPRAPHELVADATAWLLMPVQPMTMSSSVVARRGFLAVGGMDERLRSREDTHLFFRIGLGAPACAVAGHGTYSNADDSGSRLTRVLGAETADYWRATVLLYGDVLRHAPPLPPGARRELRGRLADAHVRLARLSWDGGDAPGVALQAGKALLAHPPTVARRLARLALRARLAGVSTSGPPGRAGAGTPPPRSSPPRAPGP